jgi:hypothetical protein
MMKCYEPERKDNDYCVAYCPWGLPGFGAEGSLAECNGLPELRKRSWDSRESQGIV